MIEISDDQTSTVTSSSSASGFSGIPAVRASVIPPPPNAPNGVDPKTPQSQMAAARRKSMALELSSDDATTSTIGITPNNNVGLRKDEGSKVLELTPTANGGGALLELTPNASPLGGGQQPAQQLQEAHLQTIRKYGGMTEPGMKLDVSSSESNVTSSTNNSSLLLKGPNHPQIPVLPAPPPQKTQGSPMLNITPPASDVSSATPNFVFASSIPPVTTTNFNIKQPVVAVAAANNNNNNTVDDHDELDSVMGKESSVMIPSGKSTVIGKHLREDEESEEELDDPPHMAAVSRRGTVAKDPSPSPAPSSHHKQDENSKSATVLDGNSINSNNSRPQNQQQQGEDIEELDDPPHVTSKQSVVPTQEEQQKTEENAKANDEDIEELDEPQKPASKVEKQPERKPEDAKPESKDEDVEELDDPLPQKQPSVKPVPNEPPASKEEEIEELDDPVPATQKKQVQEPHPKLPEIEKLDDHPQPPQHKPATDDTDKTTSEDPLGSMSTDQNIVKNDNKQPEESEKEKAATPAKKAKHSDLDSEDEEDISELDESDLKTSTTTRTRKNEEAERDRKKKQREDEEAAAAKKAAELKKQVDELEEVDDDDFLKSISTTTSAKNRKEEQEKQAITAAANKPRMYTTGAKAGTETQSVASSDMFQIADDLAISVDLQRYALFAISVQHVKRAHHKRMQRYRRALTGFLAGALSVHMKVLPQKSLMEKKTQLYFEEKIMIRKPVQNLLLCEHSELVDRNFVISSSAKELFEMTRPFADMVSWVEKRGDARYKIGKAESVSRNQMLEMEARCRFTGLDFDFSADHEVLLPEFTERKRMVEVEHQVVIEKNIEFWKQFQREFFQNILRTSLLRREEIERVDEIEKEEENLVSEYAKKHYDAVKHVEKDAHFKRLKDDIETHEAKERNLFDRQEMFDREGSKKLEIINHSEFKARDSIATDDEPREYSQLRQKYLIIVEEVYRRNDLGGVESVNRTEFREREHFLRQFVADLDFTKGIYRLGMEYDERREFDIETLESKERSKIARALRQSVPMFRGWGQSVSFAATLPTYQSASEDSTIQKHAKNHRQFCELIVYNTRKKEEEDCMKRRGAEFKHEETKEESSSKEKESETHNNQKGLTTEINNNDGNNNNLRSEIESKQHPQRPDASSCRVRPNPRQRQHEERQTQRQPHQQQCSFLQGVVGSVPNSIAESLIRSKYSPDLGLNTEIPEAASPSRGTKLPSQKRKAEIEGEALLQGDEPTNRAASPPPPVVSITAADEEIEAEINNNDNNDADAPISEIVSSSGENGVDFELQFKRQHETNKPKSLPFRISSTRQKLELEMASRAMYLQRSRFAQPLFAEARKEIEHAVSEFRKNNSVKSEKQQIAAAVHNSISPSKKDVHNHHGNNSRRGSSAAPGNTTPHLVPAAPSAGHHKETEDSFSFLNSVDDDGGSGKVDSGKIQNDDENQNANQNQQQHLVAAAVAKDDTTDLLADLDDEL